MRKSPTTAPSMSAAKKPIIGLSSNRKLKIVIVKRAVNLFVLRLDPDTTVTEVPANVVDVLCEKNLNCIQKEVIVVALATKHSSYASFHITVRVGLNDMQDAITHLLDAES